MSNTTNSNISTVITRTGRKLGSANAKRVLPETIHPEQKLSIDDMSTLSRKSNSYFYTNLSLERTGQPHSSLPPVTKLGRNVVCRAADFFSWMNGEKAQV